MTSDDSAAVAAEMYSWAGALFPICRSLTGDGVRQTLRFIGEHVPDLQVHEVPTGTKAFDWVVPDEWNIREGWLADASGRRRVDFADHNLHVVGYSEPVDRDLSLEELRPHLYSLPDQPDAIPYVTSYYSRTWGFCLRHRDLETLEHGPYRAYIDSTLAPGHLTYADAVYPGESEEEVLFSTYVCHPSLANNELSGPVVTTALARWLASEPRRLTYRIVFIPETIGSIVYLSRSLERMKERTIAGWVVSCVGDDRAWSMLASRRGDTLADRVSRHVLGHRDPTYTEYSYLWPNRGSDERNYCSPGIDLPVASIMRTKYGRYPEYHTSLDDLSVISPAGLGGSLEVLQECVSILENRHRWRTTVLGEPQLGKRGLYRAPDETGNEPELSALMNVLAYSDGEHDLLQMAERIGISTGDCLRQLGRLEAVGLVKRES